MKRTFGFSTAQTITLSAALLFAGGASAADILIPPGLLPGDTYQLVFVTADEGTALSTDIADYNTFVSSEAASDAALAAFDTANSVTWTIIGSTTAVNANANAPSSGAVFTLDGVQVASAAAALYSGSLLSPIDIDQNGNTLVISTWTGSNPSGGAAGGINDLGQTFAMNGESNLSTSGWINQPDAAENGNNRSYYALSSVITVAQPSGAPEPASAAMLAVAGLALTLVRKRTRSGTLAMSRLRDSRRQRSRG